MRVLFWVNKSGNEVNYQKSECRRRRNEAELTEGFDDVTLQINQPAGENRHNRNQNAEHQPHLSFAESCQNRQDKSRKIGGNAESRRRNTEHLGVTARQNLLAAVNNTAWHNPGGEMFDGQINRVHQAAESDNRRQQR